MLHRHITIWIAGVVGALVVGYGSFIVRRGFSAKDKPSEIETFVARTVRNLSLAAAPRRTNPIAVTPKDIQEGQEHFEDHCALCHAKDGSGNSETGRNLYPKPPDLSKAPTQRLSDGELYAIIANGVRFTGMPASDHSEEDNWRLVAFIRHLPTLTAAERKAMDSTELDDEHHEHHFDHQ